LEINEENMPSKSSLDVFCRFVGRGCIPAIPLCLVREQSNAWQQAEKNQDNAIGLIVRTYLLLVI
jgi:hypothetical protein